MTTELDLRGLHQPHEPDPAFVEALEQRLEGLLMAPVGDAPTIEDGAALDPYLPTPTIEARSVHRRWLSRAVLGAAAAVVLVAVIAVNVRRDDRDDRVAVETATTPLPANGWVAQSFGSIFLIRGNTDAIVNGSGVEACPAFSPDGARLMYGQAAFTGGHATLEVVGIAADGAETTVGPDDQVEPTLSPLTTIPLDGIEGIPCALWAPDGRWAALADDGEVWVIDTETAEVRRLPGYYPADLEWRPGTDELAMTGGNLVGENAPITIYDVSTGDVRTLDDVEAAQLTWSPDGRTIAYTQFVSGAADTMSGITLVDADGTNQRPLTTDDYVADHGIGVVWSPRGDEIAYQRQRADCTGNACHELSEVVVVTAIDTDPNTPIGTERVIPPVVSNLDLSQAEYNHPPPFRSGDWFADSVTWSPDGTELLYVAGSAGLLAVPVDPTRPTVALDGDALIGQVDDMATSPRIPIQQWQPVP